LSASLFDGSVLSASPWGIAQKYLNKFGAVLAALHSDGTDIAFQAEGKCGYTVTALFSFIHNIDEGYFVDR
jgi:hypothetical protein